MVAQADDGWIVVVVVVAATILAPVVLVAVLRGRALGGTLWCALLQGAGLGRVVGDRLGVALGAASAEDARCKCRLLRTC